MPEKAPFYRTYQPNGASAKRAILIAKNATVQFERDPVVKIACPFTG